MRHCRYGSDDIRTSATLQDLIGAFGLVVVAFYGDADVMPIEATLKIQKTDDATQLSVFSRAK